MALVERLLIDAMLTLLPATAPVIGLVVLAQIPWPLEAIGIVAVGAAVLLHTPELVVSSPSSFRRRPAGASI